MTTTLVISYHPLFIDFVNAELNRLAQRLGTPATVQLEPLAPGVSLAHLQVRYQHLVEYTLAHPPVYVHHMHPVHFFIRWDKTSYLEKRCVRAAQYLQSGLSFAVQAQRLDGACACFEFNVEQQLRAAPPADRGRLNRAELKLLEALALSPPRLERRHHVLDLGAAPGGWTRVLLQRGLRVTAVDPKPMRVEDALVGTLRHEPVTAQQFLLRPHEQIYDLMTNDMMLHAHESAQVMRVAADRLRPGGSAIMTVKLHGPHRREQLDQCFWLLRKAFRILRIRQLYYNKNEVTVWLQKR